MVININDKKIEGISNKVISLGLISRTGYYIVFQKKSADVTSSSHYGYYAGQPLPILDGIVAPWAHFMSGRAEGMP